MSACPEWATTLLVRRIVALVLKFLGISRYELAKRTRLNNQTIAHWVNQDTKTIRLEHLVKLRKASEMTWEKFGRMLDDEFLE